MRTRIIFLIAAILVLRGSAAHAQGSQPPIPAQPPDGTYILDEMDWLAESQEASINSIISRLDNEGIAEIAVVTLNDCGSDKKAFRKSLFDTWGIGHKDDNDGLLILVCWYAGDPALRSVEQLYGPGLNGVLNSTQTDQVAQDKFVPAFQRAGPGAGLVAMVKEYNVLLRNQGGSANLFASAIQSLKRNGEALLFILGFIVVILFQWGVDKFAPESVRERFRRDYDGGSDSGGFDGGSSGGGGGSSTRF